MDTPSGSGQGIDAFTIPEPSGSSQLEFGAYSSDQFVVPNPSSAR